MASTKITVLATLATLAAIISAAAAAEAPAPSPASPASAVSPSLVAVLSHRKLINFGKSSMNYFQFTGILGLLVILDF
ncbi:hypothetical protein RYX36_022607 [Vicia faba]